jgi:hypothetical protein
MPQQSEIKLTKNQLKRMKKKAAAAAAMPQAPSRLSLSGGGADEKWAVSSRGGECSPDCCCPTGISCHDRIVPLASHQEDQQEDESGFVSPKLSTPLSSKGDFENLD